MIYHSLLQIVNVCTRCVPSQVSLQQIYSNIVIMIANSNKLRTVNNEKLSPQSSCIHNPQYTVQTYTMRSPYLINLMYVIEVADPKSSWTRLNCTKTVLVLVLVLVSEMSTKNQCHSIQVL